MILNFYDAAGKQIGNLYYAGLFTGSSVWSVVSGNSNIPYETAKVLVSLGLQVCTGTVWFSGVRLTTVIDHDLDSLDMRLPPMLLQPIVENAIKFGLYDTTDAVTISISARAEERYVRIAVQNPFDPETSRPTKGAGFGLSSIQRRLYLLFARTDLLETRIEDHLFTTIVKIPQLSITAITNIDITTNSTNNTYL